MKLHKARFARPRPSKNQVKKLGIDAEEFKRDMVGKEAARRFNIATDKKGRVYLVAVKKGQGVAVETGMTIEQLAQFYPLK